MDRGAADGPYTDRHALIAEVRRLREIIHAEHEAIVVSRVAPITTAFQREARAIRDEQGHA